MDTRRPRRRRSARTAYLALRRAGFDPVTAGNLTAIRVGISPTERGWTPAEVDRLLFARWLLRRRRIGGATDGQASEPPTSAS